jgi:hypothetical protein
LSSWATGGFSRRPQLHGVSYLVIFSLIPNVIEIHWVESEMTHADGQTTLASSWLKWLQCSHKNTREHNKLSLALQNTFLIIAFSAKLLTLALFYTTFNKEDFLTTSLYLLTSRVGSQVRHNLFYSETCNKKVIAVVLTKRSEQCATKHGLTAAIRIEHKIHRTLFATQFLATVKKIKPRQNNMCVLLILRVLVSNPRLNL